MKSWNSCRQDEERSVEKSRSRTQLGTRWATCSREGRFTTVDRPNSGNRQGRRSRIVEDEDEIDVTCNGARETGLQLKGQKRGGRRRIVSQAELLSLERPPSLLRGGLKYPPASRGV